MWDLIKRIFHFISTIIMYSLFFIVILVVVMVALYFGDQYIARSSGKIRAPLFGAYIIISQSMEPTIHVGDAVVTMRASQDKIKKNDVITFFSDQYGVVVTHRVVGIFDTPEGGVAYRTKGDNNNVEDNDLIPYSKVYGKFLIRIPYLGHIQQYILSGYGWVVVFVLPCLFIIGNDMLKLIRDVKNDGSKESKKDGNPPKSEKENK